jgi:hypothetical protein
MEALLFGFLVVSATVIVVMVRLPAYRRPEPPPTVEPETIREDDRLAG